MIIDIVVIIVAVFCKPCIDTHTDIVNCGFPFGNSAVAGVYLAAVGLPRSKLIEIDLYARTMELINNILIARNDLFCYLISITLCIVCRHIAAIGVQNIVNADLEDDLLDAAESLDLVNN